MLFFAGLIHTVFLFAFACCLGRGTLRCHDLFETGALRTAAEAAFGLALISTVIFFLVWLHCLQPAVLWGLAGLCALFGSYEFFYRFRGGEWFIPKLRAGHFLLFVYVIWIVLNAWLPATDRDEMIYHLQIPKKILQAGGLSFSQDNIYAYFPQLGEMLTLFGLGTWGEFAARLTHLLFGVLLVSALFGFTLEKLNRTAAWLAVFLFLSVPSVTAVFPLAYADLSYALYAFLALAAIFRFEEYGKPSWIIFAGALAGAACAVKYNGIQYVLLLAGFFLVLQLVRRRAAEGLKDVIMFFSSSFLFLLPYLLRNFQLTGWPLFPFALGGLPLHSSLNWDPERAQLYLGWLGHYGNRPGFSMPGSALWAPFEVFARGRFNEPEFYDGILGPVFLFIPFLLFQSKADRNVKALSFFSFLFLYYWAFTTRQARFLIPLLPVLCYLLACGIEKIAVVATRRFWFWIISACIFLNLFTGVQEVLKHDPVPFWEGKETRENFLLRNIPQYGIYQEANKKLGAQDNLYLINMKNYGYYLNMPWRGDFVFERYELNRDFEPRPSSDLLKDFFGRRGITHLLIDRDFISRPEIGFRPEAFTVFEAYLKGNTVLLAQDGPFALYQIKR